MKEHSASEIGCRRCGKCCYAIPASIAGEDMDRWKAQGKVDIVHAMEHSKPVWAGDIVVSSVDGKVFSTCPFLRHEGRHHTCAIYEDRPNVCRNYAPGSSELCSQFKKA